MSKFHFGIPISKEGEKVEENTLPSEEEILDTIVILDEKEMAFHSQSLPDVDVEKELSIDEMREDKIKKLKLLTHEILLKSDWLISRHKEQTDLGIVTSISEGKYKKLLLQRQYIRDHSSFLEEELKKAATKKEIDEININILEKYFINKDIESIGDIVSSTSAFSLNWNKKVDDKFKGMKLTY